MHAYDLLFADQDLDELVTELELAPGSPLEAARARIWEGRFAEASTLAASAKDDHAMLISALARIKRGAGAERTLLALAENPQEGARLRLWAWRALRTTGQPVPGAFASELLGVVFEVPMNAPGARPCQDTFAVYADGGVRLLGHAANVVIKEPVEGEPVDPRVSAVIAEGLVLLNIPAAERARDLPIDRIRITGLSALGVHAVELGWPDTAPDATYGPLFAAATALLDAVTQTT